MKVNSTRNKSIIVLICNTDSIDVFNIVNKLVVCVLSFIVS